MIYPGGGDHRRQQPALPRRRRGAVRRGGRVGVRGLRQVEATQSPRCAVPRI